MQNAVHTVSGGGGGGGDDGDRDRYKTEYAPHSHIKCTTEENTN